MALASDSNFEVEQLRRERDELVSERDKLAADLVSLNQELAETNKGVVALYSELDEQADALRNVSDLKSRFLSYMSHEFRTPLSSIRSIARILLDQLDGPLTDEQEKQVRFIQDSAAELTEMVNDLLDLAKVEAGRISVSPIWFKMVDLFAALRGMFKPVMVTDSVSLIFEEPVGLPSVYSDNAKLSQILRNFISNALKFTPAGEVRVSVRLVENEMIMFSVSDTGIGIAPSDQASLFEDFVQVDSLIQKKLRGTGLGLSLSKKLAALLGGNVSVKSALGVGSTFSVTIPAKIQEADPDVAPVGEPSALNPREAHAQ